MDEPGFFDEQNNRKMDISPGRKPSWLRIQLATNDNYKYIKKILRSNGLHTVCEEAKCPNVYECFSNLKTATIMVFGDTCTRHCLFCSVKKGRSSAPDSSIMEPGAVINMVKALGLQHLVITMVTRDDLGDGGAESLASLLEFLQQQVPECTVEVLCSDFKGEYQAIERVIMSRPAIFAHNLETIRRLSPVIRPEASYDRSLQVLKWAKDLQNRVYFKRGFTKSGLMLGLGEEEEEVLMAMDDLKKQAVDILVLGQYLQPTGKQYPVQKYWHPDEFAALKEIALAKGFLYCEAGPLVRSSFHSKEQFNQLSK